MSALDGTICRSACRVSLRHFARSVAREGVPGVAGGTLGHEACSALVEAQLLGDSLGQGVLIDHDVHGLVSDVGFGDVADAVEGIVVAP